MQLRLRGLNKAVAKTKAQRDRLKNGAASFVRESVAFALRELARNTPQWSGSLAASWYVDLNYKLQADYYSPYSGGEDWRDLIPNQRFIGDRRAVAEVMASNAEFLKAIRWNSKVSIVNIHPMAVTFAIGNKADPEVQGLRPGNFIPDDIMAVKLVSQKLKLQQNTEALRLASQFKV